MKKLIVLIVIIGIILGGYFFYKKVVIKNDDFVPNIDIIDDTVYIDNDNYDPLTNLKYSFGKSGGNVKCSSITLGENIVTCTAKGNNMLETSISFKVIKSYTYKKSAIFFGDSITYGFLNKGYSWANYIGDKYDFEKVVNAGISDYRVSTYDDKNKWLVSEVDSHKNEENFDYVLLQGGINDVLYNTPIGKISSFKDKESFDINTFAGGLEMYIYTVLNNYPDSKIGYILTYYTPKYTERGLIWSYDDYKDYIDMTKKILDKWDIKYLDLFDDKFTKLLEVDTEKYLPDYLHLNKEGYELIYPYIYEFINTL